ncbi:MAG: alcohol dehydrogenase catalytic domain-containing protein [Phycisphaerae bacterium]
MNALVFDGSLTLARDHPRPVPGPDDELVRVHRAGVCATDLEIVQGYMDFRGVPGHEFVGTVASGPPSLTGRRVVDAAGCGATGSDQGVDRSNRRLSAALSQNRERAEASAPPPARPPFEALFRIGS